MILVCDRCGESFRHPDWMDFAGYDELDEEAYSAITRCFALPNKEVVSYDNEPIADEPIILCHSCMAALNDWLKRKTK